MPGFFPGKKYGGPPVSINNFCSLMQDHDCFIVTRNHDFGDSVPYNSVKDGWNVRSNAKVMYLSDSKFKASTFESVISEIKPDVIYLQSLFSVSSVLPPLFLARKYCIPVILAPRGELCKGAFKKKYKKIPYIWFLRMFGLLKNVLIQSTSDEESLATIKYLNIDESRIKLLPNIPSIPPEEPKHELKEPNHLRLLFLSRIVRKKNLHSAIMCLKGVEGNVVFDIYGPREDSQYWEYCQNLIAELPKNIQVNYCGLVSHEEVHKVFSAHDAFLFPTFSENYGHVIAEALFNNCIPIISDQTPWTDMNDFNAGWAISLDCPERYTDAVNHLLAADDITMDKYRDNIKNYIDSKMNIESLRRSYSDFIDKGCTVK